MFSITRIFVLLGVCIATLLSCDVTQAEEKVEVLSQPVAAPISNNVALPHPTKVANQASPAGKQIMIHFQLVEISLSKMQRLGVDLTLPNGQKIQKLTGSDFLTGTPLPAGLIDALRKNKIARVLAAPRLATYANRLATLRIGSDVPFSAKQNDQQSSTDFVSIGTQLEVIPEMVDDQNVRLQIKLDWSALKETPANHTGAPSVRHIKMNTAIQAKLGEATLLSGSRRTVRQGGQDEELIMILTVTPELADRMDQAVSRAPTGKRLR